MRKPSPVLVLGTLAVGFGLSVALSATASADAPSTAQGPGRSPVSSRAGAPTVAPSAARPADRKAKSVVPSGPVADFVNSAMLGVRRSFFNQAPTVSAPGPGQQLPSGVIWDQLHASDPEGDALRYTVDQAPSHGTVSVSDLGAYTYTPGAGFTGTDTFAVGVEETSYHVNLLDLFGSRHRQVAVMIDSGPADVPAVVVDDFDGPAGARPSSQLWNYETGKGVGDGLQTYTDSPDNVRLDGQGHLVIEARPAANGYTSGFLTTKGKLDMLYGTLTARIRFPAGQGIWPAFWMLGSTFSRATWNHAGPKGWPGCGEIDIMELANTASTYHVTLHGPNAAGLDFSGAPYWQPIGTTGAIADLSAGFHDYWITREPDLIVIGVDDTTLATFTPASLPAGSPWVFNEPMFAILNVAVGGPWPGPPDAGTPWPATLLVDSFRFTPSG